MAARSAATMTGLGAVFTHIDLGTTTSLAYHDRHGRLPHQPWVPAWPGAASLSFAGVAFRQTVVWKVRLTSGTIGLGPHGDPKQGNDIVVMDNFIQEAALRRRPSGRRQGGSPPPDVAPPPGSSRIRLGPERESIAPLRTDIDPAEHFHLSSQPPGWEGTAAASLDAILYYGKSRWSRDQHRGNGTFTICTPFLSAFCSVSLLSTSLGAASAASSFPRPLRSAPFAHQRPGATAAPWWPRPPGLPRNRRPQHAAAGSGLEG
jgi:hypothetical protein